ncbi:hypothetical protein Pla108_26980 [Botrimarina colliarenosi]|uniref:Uncharacterized protein n=1 Tax=Botrimarina colliarenosi TaxID=2528001 RepID=A0A5C6AA66_9BACT|nr:plasmid replication protein RepC [Botrimarina colliarenosi]TWT96922.1 hypothetical protein Pla108_26980 [Botrimarina colliarenosi]
MQCKINEPRTTQPQRLAAQKSRFEEEHRDPFAALEEDADRYQLLLLVKRVGKEGGFSPRMIQLLDYYLAYTTKEDWEEGSRPIVFQSVGRTAMDLGVSERQIQKLEKQLFAVGAITWRDSGNHKRYGLRDKRTGRLVYAFGVDLTPLGHLKNDLEDKLHQKRLYVEAWRATKRDISMCRRRIRSALIEADEQGIDKSQRAAWEEEYGAIAHQLRTHHSLQELRGLLVRHTELLRRLSGAIGQQGGRCARSEPTIAATDICADRSEEKFAHLEYSNPINQVSSRPAGVGLQEGGREEPEDQRRTLKPSCSTVSLRQALSGATDRFLQRLPHPSSQPNWSDLIEAAYEIRGELRISQQSWNDACRILGRPSAAVCVLLTDRGTTRVSGRVRLPDAYFQGMVRKGSHGKLRLDTSLLAHQREV